MAGLKELKRRLASVRTTRKTTYAMKLVSAAKLRRVQDTVTRASAYQIALEDLLNQLLLSADDTEKLSHPLIEARDVGTSLLVIAGGSRGLAGGYNANINRAIERFVAGESVMPKFIAIGRRPVEYLRTTRRPAMANYENLPEDPFEWNLDTIANSVIESFKEGQIREVAVLYTKFTSALSVTPVIERLLPLSVAKPNVGTGSVERRKVIFEPSRQSLLAELLPRILETKIRNACFNAKASEHGSRMTAMDAATKNADELTYKLQLTYNKVRQSGITSELLDILGGAEATQ